MSREELLDYMESRGIHPEEINVVQLVDAYMLIENHGTVGEALLRCINYENEIKNGTLVYQKL